MYTQLRSILTSLTLGVVVLACSGDDAPSTASEAIKEGFRAACAKAFDCKSAYDPAMHDGDTFESRYGTSESDCYGQLIEVTSALFGADYFTKVDASVAAGRIAYDAADAGTCLDEGAALSCDAYLGQNGVMAPDTPACETMIVGQVPIGGACTTFLDCVDGSSCDSATSTCK